MAKWRLEYDPAIEQRFKELWLRVEDKLIKWEPWYERYIHYVRDRALDRLLDDIAEPSAGKRILPLYFDDLYAWMKKTAMEGAMEEVRDWPRM